MRRTRRCRLAVQLTSLARVARGQPRLLQSTRTDRSAIHSGVAALFPKLTVRRLARARSVPERVRYSGQSRVLRDQRRVA
jgi:hypothetical protein